MTKEVLIRVKGLQTLSESEEEAPIEIFTVGEYHFRNGKHYVRYEEMHEGFVGVTANYLKISPQGMEVRKKGITNVHMVFEENKKNKTFYHTPYGDIEMGITAAKLYLEEEEDDLRVRVDYVLEMNDEYVADCYISIAVQSKKQEKTMSLQ